MTFRGDDDFEYIDDDDFYDPDIEDDDDDEELGGDWRSRLGSRSSSLPGRDRSSGFGSSGTSSFRSSVYGDKSDDSSGSNPRSKTSPFSGGSNPPSRTSGSGTAYSSGGTRDSFRDRVSRSGDTGQLRSPTGSSSGKDWRSSLSNKDKPPSSSKRPNDSNLGSRRSPVPKSNSKDDKVDTKSGSRFNLGGKKDTSKTSTKDSGDSDGKNRFGIRSRLGGNSDSKKDDKKATKKDNNDSGKNPLSGFRNRLGGSSDSQKDNKKGDSDGGKNPLSGFRNRFGGNDSKKDDKKAFGRDRTSASKGDNAVATSALAGVSNRLSGLRNRLPIGNSEDDKDASGRGQKSDNQFRNRDTKGNKQSALGASKASKPTRGSASNKEDKGGGLFGNLFNRVRGDDKSSRPAPKARTSKAPKVDSGDWLDLDRKLDLVGVGLVFGAIVLFASALSQEQAVISAVHQFIGELFGWGAMAVPIAMFAVGMWLIVRHFGDEAPTIDPLRLGGIIIGFIAALTLFQYIDSFSYVEIIPKAINTRIAECSAEFQESCTADVQNLNECQVSITANCLEGLVKYSYQRSNGGGIVGGWLYLTLVNNVTEIGGFVIVVMVSTFAIMMITHLSMAEIAIVFIGIGRSFRTSMAQNAAKRRAQRLKAEQEKALLAQNTNVTVSTPAPAQLPGFSNAGALPEPTENGDAPIPIEERDILIRRGGQAFSSTELEQQPNLLGNTPQPQPSNGLFGRLFNRNKSAQQPQPVPVTPATTVASTASAGFMGRLLNRNNDKTNQPNQQPPQTQPVPNTMPTPAQAVTLPTEGNGLQQPVQPIEQPQQQPVTQPQAQPVMASQPETEIAQPVQSPTEQPQQQPVAQPQPTASPQAEVLARRQDRLNALRSGITAPPSLVKDTPQPVTSNGGDGNDYNPFGRPDDIPTHESENLPGQKYSSTKPITTSSAPAPQINPRKNNVEKPVSSGPVNQSKPRTDWKLPDYRTLLSSGSEQEFDREQLLNKARIIEETLASFGAPGRVVEVNTGPVITQFGVEPDYLTARSGKKSRVKVSAIAQLDKDLQLALGAKTIRVEAPVPGKGYVGIEVPNAEASLVSLRDVMESEDFQDIDSPLAIALGMSVDGSPISADLTQMPHLLIAGTTGSGKSVCVNSVINSIMARNSPETVKFIMVDPKRVELTGYNGIPHLVAPVVVELERILGVLKWVTREMDERYKKFSNAGARNIVDYNKHRDPNLEGMPYIVVIIDELADLMMLAPEETERTITRIAALARATGIHLVIATQRPSVDVVTGLIKANFPARIAFAVAGGVDSRVILDQPGAERLLGKGDMLYLSGNSPAPLRLQGVFLSDLEINNISRYWKMQSVGVEPVKPITISASPVRTEEAQSVASTAEPTRQTAFWDSASSSEPDDPQKLAVEDKTGNPDPQEDELYETAVQMVRRLDKASISLLQRRLRIGYTRAARLIDMMEERDVIGPAKEGSSKPRDVIPE